MKTIPVIHRMIMKRLSISRPNVETDVVGIAGRVGQPPVGRERGVDESAHAEDGGQRRTGDSSNARKRSLMSVIRSSSSVRGKRDRDRTLSSTASDWAIDQELARAGQRGSRREPRSWAAAAAGGRRARLSSSSGS